MRRLVALVFAAAFAIQAPALAETVPPKTAATAKKKTAARWPMGAERFRAEIEARIGKKRLKLQQAIEKRKLGPAKAQALRGGLETRIAHLRAKVTAVTADGVVTRDEASQVRAIARALH